MKVALIGGRGFFGSAVQEQLVDHEVLTVDHRPGPASHREVDVLDTARLAQVLREVDAVVNFVGLTPTREPRKTSYHEVHVQGAGSVALACEQAGVSYLLHVSALGAALDAPTEYLRTKAAGERALSAFSGPTGVLRPSVLLDAGNELVVALRRLSVTRVFFRSEAYLQPVYRVDAASLVTSLIKEAYVGVVEVGGPDVLTLSDLARLVYSRQGRRCFLFPLWLARLGATALAVLPRTRIGFDQVRSLSLNNTLVPDASVKQVVTSTSVTAWLS